MKNKKEAIINKQNSKREQSVFTVEQISRELECFRKANEKIKQEYSRISVFRLVIFCIGILGILVAVAAHLWWGWLLAVVATGVFVWLLMIHAEKGNHQNYLERLIQVYERYQMRLQDEWHGFAETGKEFLQEQDYVSLDLDVLGANSLYQMICTAHTQKGKQRLAEVLCLCSQSAETVSGLKERQKAVAELAEKKQFSANFEALAMQCEGGKELTNPNQEREHIVPLPFILKILAWGYPVVFGISIVGAFLHWWNSAIILVLFFLALGLSFALNGYCQKAMGRMVGQSRTMQTFLYMMETLATESFEASYLKDLQKAITGEEEEGVNLLQGLRSLERLIAAYNIRYNPIAHWLLSGICLYDLHVAAFAITWEQKYGAGVEKGIHAIGEVEMLSSLAVLQRVSKVSYPELLEAEAPEFSMRQIYHPLLPVSQAVANDIALQHQTVVITGSNMSGKTTFLRTVGLNLVLAYAGAPVCGEAVTASFMRIFTSMRVVDDVQHGISTFYAEILRIKEMVEYGKAKTPMLCLIDEIFKGTNSADRIVGAEAVIQRLSNSHTIAMVSTHDFELCKLAKNYHFEEYYEEDEIRFDYRLQNGMCTTTNALYLLRMAGLTDCQ